MIISVSHDYFMMRSWRSQNAARSWSLEAMRSLHVKNELHQKIPDLLFQYQKDHQERIKNELWRTEIITFVLT